MKTLQDRLKEIRFYNTGNVKSHADLVPLYRTEVIKLLTMLETCMRQRDDAIMSVPLSGTSEERYKNQFNDELLTILNGSK